MINIDLGITDKKYFTVQIYKCIHVTLTLKCNFSLMVDTNKTHEYL